MNLDSILYKISKVIGDIPTHLIFDKVADGCRHYKVYKDEQLICRARIKGNVMEIYRRGKYIGKEYLNKEELAKL